MKSLIIALALVTSTLRAEDFLVIEPIKFQVTHPDAEERLADAVARPEALLMRFKPEGAVISNKQVSGNTIRFLATKKVLFISKTVQVNGIVDTREDALGCGKNQRGFNIVLNLDGSDALLTDNVDHLDAKLCVSEVSENTLNVIVKGKILKGRNYSSVTGPVATEMILVQVKPLIKALNDVINSN